MTEAGGGSAAGVIPDGYDSFAFHGAHVVALAAHADAVRAAMGRATLHEYAAAQPGARAFAGRGTAWGATLPDGAPVVVRHSRHGGLLAPVTGDLFVRPTRAAHELAAARTLARHGVPTPEVVAYAVYPAFGPFARADVATRLLDGTPFPDAWKNATGEAERRGMLDAVRALLVALRRAGALHPDLNASNVLICQREGTPQAAVLDVDRMRFSTHGNARIAARNAGRLTRSLHKWSTKPGYDSIASAAVRLGEAAEAP